MQEVDTFGFLMSYLEHYGYAGRFQPKTRSPCTLVGNQNNIKLPPDGVAIFYKHEKLRIINENVYKHTYPVAMLIHFKFVEHDKDFLVGTTHLKAAKNRKGEYIRLGQLNILLSTWLDIKRKSNNIDLFIGCDLNSPHINACGFSPMAYNSVVNGKLFMEKYVQGKGNKQKDYVHGYGLDLSSAYCVGLGAEPPFTTYKSWPGGNIACHTIDYIFYERQKWNVTQLLRLNFRE
eukprot:972914_1